MEPCWPLFRSKRGGTVRCRPLFCCIAFFNRFVSNFWSPSTDGVPHFWPPSPMGYPIFGRVLDPSWCQLGAILGHFGARAGPGWAGGVTRSAKNYFWLHKIIQSLIDMNALTGHSAPYGYTRLFLSPQNYCLCPQNILLA